MRFPERAWRGFGPFVLVLSLLDHGVVRAAAQVAASNPSLLTSASKAEQSETMPLAFSQKAFPDAIVGLPFHSSVQAIGGSGLYGLTVTGDLPPGLIVETGTNTIAVGGVPTEAGHYRLQIDVRDADGAALQGDFTIKVSRRLLSQFQTFERFISIGETFTFNDAENVFFPVVISDNENFAFADSHGNMDSAFLTDGEGFTFADLETIRVLFAQTISFPAPTSPVTYPVLPIPLAATGGASRNPVVFSVVSGPGSVSGTNGTTLTITGVGTVVVAANQAGNVEYAAANQVTQSIVVNAEPQTINFTPPASPVNYGVSPITLSATGGASGNPVVFSVVSGPGSVSGANGATLTITGVGTVVVAANQAGDALYAAATQATQSVVVNAAPQAIAFPAPASPVTYPVSPVPLSATGGASGNPVVFSVASGPGSVSGTNGTTLTITDAGTVVVAANQAGSTLYAAATQVTRSIVVNPPPAAILISPKPGSQFAGTGVTFTWTPGAGVTNYWFNLGTAASGANAKNIYSSGSVTALSETVTGLPTNGETIYATLYSEIAGVFQPTVYIFYAYGPAALITPAAGTKLTASTTFTWTPGTGITTYWLNVGTAATSSNAKDIYSSGPITTLSKTVTGIPTYGETLYVTLYSEIAGVYQPIVYTYTASGSPVAAALTTPAPSTKLTSSSVTFTWSPGEGVTYYWFNLGTGASGAAAKNIYSGSSTTATSVTVTGLPINGETIYATLYSYIAGVWQPTLYTYTAQ